jgi:hypothetical protein
MLADDLWPLLERSLPESAYAAADMLQSQKPSGYGFFPSCTGTWLTPRNPPHRTLLFLGQDFGTEDHLLPSGETTKAVPTWRHLEELMSTAGIDANCCFFSNVVMGVRKPGSRSIGRSPAFKHPGFINDCADFLKVQVARIRPHGIVVMGLHALEVLRMAGTGVPDAEVLRDWDAQTERLPISIRIGGWAGPLVLIVHPSFRPQNVWRRSPTWPIDKKDKKAETEAGKAHEAALLKLIRI